MKKHEACHHLNLLAGELRNRIKYSKENAAKEDTPDHMKQYEQERIIEAELCIKALDIAGDALTK